MARFTTIVTLVAGDADAIVTAVEAGATNVSAVAATVGDPSETRSAWSEAERRRNVFTMTAFDPHADLVDAWVRRLGGDLHALDAAATLVHVDSLPEYYFIDEAIEDDRVHWYLGLLRSLAPRRVVPVVAEPDAVVSALAQLEAGPALPAPKTLVAEAERYVPTGLAVAGATPSRLTVP